MKYVYVTDPNFVYTGDEEATYDLLESQLQSKDVYTGPFPYASWDKPPKHDSKTQYALLVDKKWQIRTRLAGNWWNKETAENIFVTDPYDGDLTDYTNIEPPPMQEGDDAVFKNGAWKLTKGPVRQIAEIKAATSAKIIDKDNVGPIESQATAAAAQSLMFHRRLATIEKELGIRPQISGREDSNLQKAALLLELHAKGKAEQEKVNG